MKTYYVYILKCNDDSYYVGVTDNIERRLSEHNEGYNKKAYTYRRRPVKLAFVSEFSEPGVAIEAEKQIKGWSRRKKIALINSNWRDLKRFSECRNHTSHKNKPPFDLDKE
jgi:putative endonuclease